MSCFISGFLHFLSPILLDLTLADYLAGCFKLTSCKANSTSQNIHAYGIMLIVSRSIYI